MSTWHGITSTSHTLPLLWWVCHVSQQIICRNTDDIKPKCCIYRNRYDVSVYLSRGLPQQKLLQGTTKQDLQTWCYYHLNSSHDRHVSTYPRAVCSAYWVPREYVWKVKPKLSLYRPWRPLRLREVEAPTFSKQSAHRWRWGSQPYPVWQFCFSLYVENLMTTS
jgi:hypothetical protein